MTGPDEIDSFQDREVSRRGTLWSAIERSQLVIEFEFEFEFDGTVSWANDRFLDALGYRLDEVVGRHHRMFCEPAYANGAGYRDFWAKLAQGRFDTDRYARIARSGRTVWIQATYTPILSPDGVPVKVVKLAEDTRAATTAARAMMTS